MIFDVQVRADERRAGVARGTLDRRYKSGEWQRVHRGIYIRCPEDPEEQWIARLHAHLRRAGGDAAVSHRAAARLHGLDGNWTGAEDVIAPTTSTFRSKPAIRSSTLLPGDIVHCGPLPVTSVPRTLIDLGKCCSPAQVELALESALRGIDPRRPRTWQEDRLAAIVDRLSRADRRQPGAETLRSLLARRPDGEVPTGSAAETLMVQALRAARVNAVERQLEVRILGRKGETLRKAFPDLFVPAVSLAIEVDGAEAHDGAALDRDLVRQNDVSDLFPLRRFAARRVMADPTGVAQNVVAKVRELMHSESRLVIEPDGPPIRVGRYRVSRVGSLITARLS